MISRSNFAAAHVGGGFFNGIGFIISPLHFIGSSPIFRAMQSEEDME
jgi:hypothetical protein